MKIFVISICIMLSLVGCGKQSAAELQAKNQAKPGYQAANTYCTQCHALPFGDQHPPAAWPDVVSRMEGYMESAHRQVPTDAERAEIISYFQSSE